MASRRLRIKPIANVPVRRGKVNIENERSEATAVANTSSFELEEPKTEIVSQPEELVINSDNVKVKQNTSTNEEVISSNPLNADVLVSHTTSLNPDTTVLVEANNLSENDKDATSTITSVPNKKGVPPGLARKRVKPAVSILAASRRPRDLNKTCNDKIKECPPQNDSGNRIKEDNDKESRIVSPNSQKFDKEFLFAGNKGVGVGIPGITQLIPTGTAIRLQHDNVAGSTPPFVGKEEALQSVCEPDLPSEAASGENSISFKPSSEVDIKPRPEFIKPTSQVIPGIRALQKYDNQVQKSSSSDLTLLCEPKSKLSESRRGYTASAGESDDDSGKSLSEASTISPVRKSLDVSRPRFVKPTPRYIEASARRNSIQSSASESEDESRRSLSIATTITPPNKRQADFKSEEPPEKRRKEEFDLPEKKKNRRTQNSCTVRLAKARMEFQDKFGNETPDRSRLTMFDLIFYNPTTNPMKSSPQDRENTKSLNSTKLNEEEKIIEERLEEEQVDEPSGPNETNETQEDEKDMAMPVPQVKVGPDGQIILDEKSLVIERTGAKKGREDLANSAVIVDYGTGSTGYGTYSKKIRKSKDWSAKETLKFYRALNTVGTDFSLMQLIFPKRTRQDLKTKYKKEDRTNRYLVEKALLHPLDFDLTDLQKELEREEQEARENTIQELTKKIVPVQKKLKKHAKHGSFLTRSMNAADTGTKKYKGSTLKRKTETPVAKKNFKRICSSKNEESDASSDEENELDYNYENELTFNTVIDDDSKPGHDTSDTEVAELEYLTKPRKPTRSGRIPQPKKLVEPEDSKRVSKRKKESGVSGLKLPLKYSESHPMPLEDLTNMESKTPPSKSLENQPTVTISPENQPIALENLTDIEPGSLVVLATQSPTNPGHQIYKVFMVTPSGGTTISPLTVPLASPILNSLTSNFVNGNPEPCNLPDAQVGNIAVDHMASQENEPLSSYPGQVHVEPLTNKTVQFLPDSQITVSPVQEDDIQFNELTELVPVQPTTVSNVLSQQQGEEEI